MRRFAALAVALAGERRPRVQHILAVGFAAAGGLAALALLGASTSAAAVGLEIGGVFGAWTFVPDGLGVFLAAMLIACLVPIIGFLIFQRPFLRGTGLGGAVKG